MAFFTVTASQRGNKVTFEIGTENDYPNNIKEALVLAHDEANNVFGYEILSLLTNQQMVLSLAMDFISWTILAPFINSFCYIWDGIYIGATASKAMRNSMLMATAVFFLPAYYLGFHFLISINW